MSYVAAVVAALQAGRTRDAFSRDDVSRLLFWLALQADAGTVAALAEHDEFMLLIASQALSLGVTASMTADDARNLVEASFETQPLPSALLAAMSEALREHASTASDVHRAAAQRFSQLVSNVPVGATAAPAGSSKAFALRIKPRV